MFSIYVLGCLGAVYAAAPATLQWQTNLEDAKRIAAQTNRLVLVHFWAPSCKPCLELEKNVFSQPQVQQFIDARFVPIKINADDAPTTTKRYGISRLPTDLILTPAPKLSAAWVVHRRPTHTCSSFWSRSVIRRMGRLVRWRHRPVPRSEFATADRIYTKLDDARDIGSPGVRGSRRIWSESGCSTHRQSRANCFRASPQSDAERWLQWPVVRAKIQCRGRASLLRQSLLRIFPTISDGPQCAAAICAR